MDATPHHSGIVHRVIDDVLSALALTLGARRGAALILDADLGRCRAITTLGLTDGERERIEEWLTIAAAERPYWERFAAEARAVYVPPSAGETRSTWQSIVDVAGHLVAPLVGGDGRLLGILALESEPPSEQALIAATQLGRVAATAIEQTVSADAQAAELARNAVLLDIVREVDRPVELPQVLATICRKTVEAFGCRQVTVYFQSRKHRASLPLADYGTPPHVAARFVGGRYQRGDVPHEDEVAAGRIVIIDRRQGTPAEDLALLDQIEIALLVMVPLRDDDATVRGSLTIGFDQPRELTAGELRALEMVGRHAAMAIIRARFLHWTAEAGHFRAAVSALAVELNAATSRTQALQTLCTRGCELFGVHTAAILIGTGDRLVAAAARGELATPADLVLSLDDVRSPAVRAFLSGEVVLENDRQRSDDAPALERLRSLLAIPLIESEGPVGVLVLGALRPRLFRPNVVQEAPLLGALAAAVLRNVELMGQLHDSNQRLHRLSALKDQFLANVSHDLRTPLNVIIGFAQLALENTFGTPPPELREILDRMLASACQQLTLVQDLLDVSRLELNGLSVKLAPMSIAQLFADMEFLVTSLVRHKPVRVVVDAPGDDIWVHADGDRTRQILTNLLANAAKFTDEGTICLRAVVGGDAVRVDVVDSGIGIPTDQFEAIFEPFRQVEGNRAVLGTGLGLAIAHRLAQLMHGTLNVTSSLGHGSTFSLTLPIAHATERPLRHATVA
jgi:signal transduction histidine kinase